MILCGHSFGGIYAIELASRAHLDVRGLVLIASVLSHTTYKKAVPIFQSLMTPELQRASAEFERAPSDEKYSELLGLYGAMYFKSANIQSGSAMLARDQMCARSFTELLPTLSTPSRGDEFVRKLKDFKARKLFLAGADEVLFTAESLKEEALSSGCEFEVIVDASHCVTYDQPDAVAAKIEANFLKIGQP